MTGGAFLHKPASRHPGVARWFMLDVCCGLKGASQAMEGRDGWRVVTVDINPVFNPDVVADVRRWDWAGFKPDLIWCSPPCNEFSRESMPWCRTGAPPDLSIVNACKALIARVKPRWWIIENVRGAVKYLGPPAAVRNPFFLWGNFPPMEETSIGRHKMRSSGKTAMDRAKRAKVPMELSLAVARSIEGAFAFEGVAP